MTTSWIFYWLNSPEGQQKIEQISIGSTQKAITIVALKSIKIQLPHKDEQSRTVHVLDSITDKININTQINQTLEQIAQALFKSWFVDFDPVKAKIDVLEAGGTAEAAELAAMGTIAAKSPEQLADMQQSQPEAYQQLAQTAALFPAAMQDSELGEIPEGWNKGTIEDIAQFSYERKYISDLNLSNYISTENMQGNRGGITIASSLPSSKMLPIFKEKDILISNIRPYFKKIWLAEFKGARSPDVLGISTLDPNETEFTYNLLFQNQFFEYMMATSKGAKMPRGDKEAIKKFGFPLPHKILRIIFSEQVRPFYPNIKKSGKQSKLLHALRNAILPKLLSGNV